jgi:GT2 family glycosyltransferase
MLTRVALDAGADVILFVDQDAVIPPHTVVALMDRELPIVGGYYVSRRPPYLPQIYTTEDTEGHAFGARVTPRDVYWPILDYPEEPVLFEVDAIGAGCLMVRREVFEVMAERQEEEDKLLHSALEELESNTPYWLSEVQMTLLHEHVRVMDPWFEFLNDEGEDMYFCRKARAAGYKIYVDLSVKCLHLGPVPIEEAHFMYVKPHLQRFPPEGGGDEHSNSADSSG